MTGIHRARRKWLRKVAGLPIIGWVILGAAGAALAAWIVILAVTGSVSSADFDVYTVGTPTAVVTGDGTCTATRNGLETNIIWSGAVPGDTCTVTADFQAGDFNDVDAALQEFLYAAASGGEVTAELGLSCGLFVDKSIATPAVSGSVLLTLTAAGDPGTTYAFAAGDGWKFVPFSDYDGGLCN